MTPSMRYIVDDVDAAIAFYRDQFDFVVDARPGPGFALLSGSGLRLLLNEPGAGGAGAALPDGTAPAPGGWCRFQVAVDDLDAAVARLTAAGVALRGPIVVGKGGRQAIADDPSGNPVELFEAAG